MPALITHHLFGEAAVTSLPEGLVQGQEELLAFLMGNQGPDPFFARFFTRPDKAAVAHRLAHEMHEEHVAGAFVCLRQAVTHLWEEDKGVGRAFVLGMAGHYLLDRTTHPLVFAEQDAICEAGVGLEGAGVDVHAVIESDIDTWMLWQERHATVLDCPPDMELALTSRIARVAGALFSQVAWQVYNLRVGADEFGRSVRDYAFVYRRIEPAGSMRCDGYAAIERLLQPHSHLRAMAHQVLRSDECASANLERHPWTDPSTGEVSCDSFADLYHKALADYAGFVESYVRGGGLNVEEIVCGINDDGVRGTH